MAAQVEGKVFVDPAIFNHHKMSPLSRAALILHEYIYNIALEHGHENSFPTRDVVGHLIAGSGWKKMSTHELNEIFTKVLTSGPFSLSGNYKIANQSLWLESFSRENEGEEKIDRVLFHSNGNVKKAVSAKDQLFYNEKKEIRILKGMELKFSPIGKIISIK